MDIKNSKIHTGKISSINEVAQGLFYLSFETEYEIEITAGQFISVLCENHTLRRPFSVMSAFGKNIGILIKQKGLGTKYLSSLKIGEKINFAGPFGNGFNLENKKSLLIGAGVGVAPIFILNKQLKQKGIETKFCAGFLNKFSIPKGIDFDEISTDDGSFGLNGSIIKYIEEFIKEFKPEKIYACGPFIVLKLLAEIAKKHNINCEVAMEKEMACSIGVCRGCVIELSNGDNATVCQDGPVFDAKEIKWD